MKKTNPPSEKMHFAYRHRGELAALPLVVAVFCSWREYENGPLTWAVAAVLFCMGLAIRIWAQQHLHFRLAMNMQMTTTGPYMFVRNPIYIGNTLICMGLTIASELLWLLPITILVCAVAYSLAVAYEESWLELQYGDAYADYKRRVPRWTPRLTKGCRLQWSSDYLRASVLAEAYNLLFIVPLVLKEFLHRGV